MMIYIYILYALEAKFFITHRKSDDVSTMLATSAIKHFVSYKMRYIIIYTHKTVFHNIIIMVIIINNNNPNNDILPR